LTGLGFGVEPTGRHNDGCFLALFKAAAFRDPDEFGREVDEFVDYLKDTRAAAGVEEVLAPGEIERRNAQARRESGIDIEDATWSQFRALGEKYGVPVG
ncbi:MAG: Ldh family oxidoreductase, partial [Alphaproteobacteria bacterium]|nr:Ldh family oxidoreductase [Alphaproteobacteria bacterium]